MRSLFAIPLLFVSVTAMAGVTGQPTPDTGPGHVLLPPTVAVTPRCDSLETIMRVLKDGFNEVPVGLGKAMDGVMSVVIFSTPSDTPVEKQSWTELAVIVSAKDIPEGNIKKGDAIACFMATGTSLNLSPLGTPIGEKTNLLPAEIPVKP